MPSPTLRIVPLGLLMVSFAAISVRAEEAAITRFGIVNGQKQLEFAPAPGAQAYKVLRTDSLGKPFTEDGSGAVSGFSWSAPFSPDAIGFYKLKVEPMSRTDLLASVVLNRLAYGPTPDELDRIKTIGPDAYIAEQLAPESIQESLAIDEPPKQAGPDWQYVTVTGTGSSSSLYVYLTAAGEGYIDDLRLVEGSDPKVGANLIKNGDFEAALGPEWTISDNHSASTIVNDVKHGGNASLRLVASSAGDTRESSVWQNITPALSANRTYSLSFWFLPAGTKKANVTVRLSGRGVDVTSGEGGSYFARLFNNQASISDLRSWHISHAIQSKKQLLEVLLQFLENHFVTEYSKSRDWFDRFYEDPQRSQEAVNLEFKEIQRWREALLKPSCTFYDLLKISAESPAMIIYLDTVTSNGAGTQIANENYARELLELFTFGVDNGYDQNDIVETSKTWAGWRVAMQKPENEFNPLATPLFHPSNEPTKATNNVGVWTFWYRPDRHNNTAKTIFPGKTVPGRFGPPYAGRNYELSLPARKDAAGMQDGYDVIKHLADQPFTQEFISVKLCRLLIHDDFLHGVYDYTDPNLSAEGKLVRKCMEAWENSSPKGQIRAVLKAIFDSDLFRSHVAAQQKVKTPLEFTVSTVRALRANLGNTFTAESDGSLHDALNRMGSMRLFDRAEPDGYPEAAPAWISAGTLTERLRFVQSFCIARGQNGRNDVGNNTYCDPIALLKAKLPQASWQNADAVAEFFVNLFYSGEGQGNLSQCRQAAVNFLNTADNGTASPFSSLAMTGTGNNPAPYDTRVRGMVAMLMTLQRFQEQ